MAGTNSATHDECAKEKDRHAEESQRASNQRNLVVEDTELRGLVPGKATLEGYS
jgi:hypothetical protein